MKPVSILPRIACLASALLLAACATPDQPASQKPATPTLAQVMSDADAAARAGQYERAMTLLQRGGTSYPADKAPWLQMAQMKFDRGQYGDAIGHALEALERDPDDKVANSIVVVSGLRLSGKALARQAIRDSVVTGIIGHSFAWRTLPLGKMGGALVEAIIDRQFFCQIEINQQRRSSTQQRN